MLRVCNPLSCTFYSFFLISFKAYAPGAFGSWSRDLCRAAVKLIGWILYIFIVIGSKCNALGLGYSKFLGGILLISFQNLRNCRHF